MNIFLSTTGLKDERMKGRKDQRRKSYGNYNPNSPLFKFKFFSLYEVLSFKCGRNPLGLEILHYHISSKSVCSFSSEREEINSVYCI